MAAPGSSYALLDDASGGSGRHSRLYTGLLQTLTCDSLPGWVAMLDAMQAALERGLHAVPLLTYELGCALQGVPAHRSTQPLAQVLLFSDCDLMEAGEVTAWLAAQAEEQPVRPAGIAALTANVDQHRFTAAIDRIRDYIAAGDTYQVNYTYRLHFDAYGRPEALYQRLRERQPVPYGALVRREDGSALLSLSPELFVRNEAGRLVTRPMKGTAPASGEPAEDEKRGAALAADAKNRAENLMIVDLLRNDLGRICETGSVRAPALFEVNRFGSVLQMTSTVSGQLRDDVTLAALFGAIYPCGSITGAPKRRTMEIITEVETTPRGIYTGAIGWFAPPQRAGSIGDFCMSVPIRTLSLGREAGGIRKGELGVGAGIVHDSEAASEYAECQLKARFLSGLPASFELFETMYATDSGVRHFERHLSRLAASARYFGVPFDEGDTRRMVAEASASLPGPTRLRLSLQGDGKQDLRCAPLSPLPQPVGLLIAHDVVHSDDLFLRHKTSVRMRFDAAWREADACGAFDTVFFNERGQLTEGGRCNVFVKVAGRWLTPPLSSGLLPGVMRSEILHDPSWNAMEAVVTRDMLMHASQIMVCNALRGAVPARLLPGAGTA